MAEQEAPVRRLLDPNEAAAYIGRTVQTLAIWRSTARVVVPYVRCGGRIMYDRRDLDRWIDLNRTTDRPLTGRPGGPGAPKGKKRRTRRAKRAA